MNWLPSLLPSFQEGVHTTLFILRFLSQILGSCRKIVKIVSGYKAKAVVVAGYEAGCMGYTLQRSLAAVKVECRVIPPNKVPRLGSERIKTDARDAVLIARMLKNNEGVSIRIPTAEDEATRDFLRCREDVKNRRCCNCP